MASGQFHTKLSGIGNWAPLVKGVTDCHWLVSVSWWLTGNGTLRCWTSSAIGPPLLQGAKVLLKPCGVRKDVSMFLDECGILKQNSQIWMHLTFLLTPLPPHLMTVLLVGGGGEVACFSRTDLYFSSVCPIPTPYPQLWRYWGEITRHVVLFFTQCGLGDAGSLPTIRAGQKTLCWSSAAAQRWQYLWI